VVVYIQEEEASAPGLSPFTREQTRGGIP